MANRNRRITLIQRPAGVPSPADFALEETTVPEPTKGKFVVRNLFLSVDAAQRGWASDISNYSAQVPIGDVMRALAVGVIVSSEVPEYPAGDHVYGWFGWQDYCLAASADVLWHIGQPRLPLKAYAGVLGINGLTAWLAFNNLGRPKPGEIVLVTTGAGAVGSVVGQLARSLGCYPLGIVGTEWKVQQCVQRYGYENALNYKAEAFVDQLRGMTSSGVDILFDQVGGHLLDRLIRSMRVHGRIIQCGTASVATWTPVPSGLRNEREVLTRRLTWNGFVIFDHVDRFAEGIAALTSEIEAGRLVHDEDVAGGIKDAPAALQRLYCGENRGKMLLHTQ